jgi:hypothetical protein
MVGKAIQIQRLTKYEGRKWYRWVLVYPPRDPERKSGDLQDTVKRKIDLFNIMQMYIIPSVPDWMPTDFKVLHMRGGRGKGIKVVWEGKVWRYGKVDPDNSKDLLGEPPFELL